MTAGLVISISDISLAQRVYILTILQRELSRDQPGARERVLVDVHMHAYLCIGRYTPCEGIPASSQKQPWQTSQVRTSLIVFRQQPDLSTRASVSASDTGRIRVYRC